jgi:signal peptidase I
MTTIETDTQETPMRRVRPWIAALLTLFLGWGVGFFYARQPKAAFWWSAASILYCVIVGLGMWAAFAFTPQNPLLLPSGFSFELAANLINLVPTLAIAVIAWISTTATKSVPKTGSRLLGYVAVWLVPVLVSLLLAFAFRWTVMQPYRIPSGAMQPTLMVGDHLIVSKSSYGYSRYSFAPLQDSLPHGRWRQSASPQRGDLVVFRPNPEPDRDFVKRIVGVPGDRIQVTDGALYINGQAVQRQDLGLTAFKEADGTTNRYDTVRETLPGGVSYMTFNRFDDGELDDTHVFVVPPGNYFMMGDDRDNSADSRTSVVGYVPLENIIGRVDLVIRQPSE